MHGFTHKLIQEENVIGLVNLDTAPRKRKVITCGRRVRKGRGRGTRSVVIHRVVWEIDPSQSNLKRSMKLTAPVSKRTAGAEFRAVLGPSHGGTQSEVLVRKI